MTFKTAFKSLCASTALMAIAFGPAFAAAQEVVPSETTSDLVVIVDTEVVMVADMNQELADLKARESDPSAGFVTRFFLRIKIKEVENKLNIATALK